MLEHYIDVLLPSCFHVSGSGSIGLSGDGPEDSSYGRIANKNDGSVFEALFDIMLGIFVEYTPFRLPVPSVGGISGTRSIKIPTPFGFEGITAIRIKVAVFCAWSVTNRCI
jgi:hypothetical protein